MADISKISGVAWADEVANLSGVDAASIASVGGDAAPGGSTQASRWLVVGNAGKIASTDEADASSGWSELVDLGNMGLQDIAIGEDNSGNKRWVAQGDAGYLAEIWYANNSLDLTDTNNWSSVTHTNNNIAADAGGPGVAWAHNVWIAGGNAYNDGDSYCTMMASIDGGTNWSIVDEGNTVNDSTRVVCYKDGTTWFMGHQSHIWKSVDGGASWSDTATLEGTYDIYAMAYNGSGLGVAVLQGGNIYTSDDDWATPTERTSATGAYNLFGVVYAGGTINKWVACGANGRLQYSADGITWTAIWEGDDGTWGTSHIRGIATDDTTIVIVGASGKIATSTDGTSFTSRTSNMSVTLNNVACDVIGAGMR